MTDEELGRPATPEIEAAVAALMHRPYRVRVEGDPIDGYLAQAPELPGCFTAGDTPEEALAMLQEAMAGWFMLSLERGLDIPEPAAEALARA